MLQTRIVVELEKDQPGIAAYQYAIGLSFREHCSNLICTVVPQHNFELLEDIKTDIVDVARRADVQSSEGDKRELLVYLAPRTVTAEKTLLTCAIVVIRDYFGLRNLRMKPVGAAKFNDKSAGIANLEYAARQILFPEPLMPPADTRMHKSIYYAVTQSYDLAYWLCHARRYRSDWNQ